MAIPAEFLYQRLTQSSIEYIAHSILGGTQAQIEFSGQFEGQPTIWNATVSALKAEPDSQEPQYIDVKQPNHSNSLSLNVEIGLQVSRIDEPTVLMAIKMIRQYKNLRRGRHEFLAANK